MKRNIIALFACLIALLPVGCAHEKYGEYSVQAVNTETGISAGMSLNGELLVLVRNDERQAIYIPTNRVGEVQFFNCTEAPVLYVKINLFGKKGCSVLKVNLPAKGTDLKFYRHREIGKSITWKGYKAWIVDVKEVSPDGKTLRVTFDVENELKRRTGTYNPGSNVLTVK
jgi:hypothetical protein